MRIGNAIIAGATLPVLGLVEPNPAEPMVRRWASGIASLDGMLAGGLAYGRVHEIYAAEIDDASAAAGFALSLATAMGDGCRTNLWLRSSRSARRGGVLHASGWAEFGAAPDQCLFGIVADAQLLLRTAVDALRCAALGAVIVESWGRMPELDLTASRRLSLAAEKSGVPLFLLRIDAAPVPSAAQTRWQVASAPSYALPGNAPGKPAFDIELLRQRSGPSGLGWRLEWDRDQRKFRDAALSGAVVPVPARRSTADTGAEPLPQPRRYAA
jgi:protein ImuA